MSENELKATQRKEWEDLPVGAWFYHYSPICKFPHSVHERTYSGCTSVCSSPWNAPGTAEQMRSIARLHNNTSNPFMLECRKCKTMYDVRKAAAEVREGNLRELRERIDKITCRGCESGVKLVPFDDGPGALHQRLVFKSTDDYLCTAKGKEVLRCWLRWPCNKASCARKH